MATASIPVMILTGFLGAGKTSLLNKLLLQQRQLKIAVIENEFGEVAIDNDLLTSNALSVADKVIVLENGCMCCTVRGDILGAFASIAEQVASGHPLDMVLIETTGMADPLPIVRTITQTPTITASFHMKGVVTLVDACNILTLLRSDNAEAQSQISLADLVIVSKVDLVPQPSVHRTISARIRDLNPSVPILPCVRGDMDFAAMFAQLSGFDLTKVADTIDTDDSHDHDHDHDHSSCHGECDHGHDDDDHSSRHTKTKSFAIVEPLREVDPFLFAHWMRRLVVPSKESIAKNVVLYRSKAILSVAGMATKLVFHAVGDVVDREWLDVPTVAGCKIVFIGRNLDEHQVRRDFAALLRPTRVALSAAGRPSDRLGALQPALVHRITAFLRSQDVIRVASTCRHLHAVLSSLHGASSHATDRRLSHDRRLGPYLHLAVALPNLPTYMRAYKAANVEFVNFSGLHFNSPAHVDAAAVAWLELARLAEPSCRSYALDFTWRPETVAAFFGAPEPIQTSSALVKVEYDVVADDEFDEDTTDILRFRVFLVPATTADDVAGHRLVFQLTGGKTSSQVYQVSFHSIHPAFQVHVAVPDHRMPRAESKEVFYPGHPLLHAVQTEHALRFVVRVKPDGSGPLGEMCGCC